MCADLVWRNPTSVSELTAEFSLVQVDLCLTEKQTKRMNKFKKSMLRDVGALRKKEDNGDNVFLNQWKVKICKYWCITPNSLYLMFSILLNKNGNANIYKNLPPPSPKTKRCKKTDPKHVRNVYIWQICHADF